MKTEKERRHRFQTKHWDCRKVREKTEWNSRDDWKVPMKISFCSGAGENPNETERGALLHLVVRMRHRERIERKLESSRSFKLACCLLVCMSALEKVIYLNLPSFVFFSKLTCAFNQSGQHIQQCWKKFLWEQPPSHSWNNLFSRKQGLRQWLLFTEALRLVHPLEVPRVARKAEKTVTLIQYTSLLPIQSLLVAHISCVLSSCFTKVTSKLLAWF